ncbi:MAG: DUF4296 domain-containing protein [Bacteroidota bacterium]
MKIHMLLLFSFLLLLTACIDQPKIKDLPIEMDQLVIIMTDAYVAEAATQNFTPDIKDSISEMYYEQIFEIHNVSREEYEQSLDIIKEYPVVMDTIYSRMTRYLTALEALDPPKEKK